jgi:hypothetical protein
MNPLPFLLDGGLKAFFRQIPGWLWIAMLIGLAVALGFRAHQNAVKATFNAGYAAGVIANEQAHIAAQAKADAAATAINSKLRTDNDEENSHIRAAADDLRLRGPGKAACPGVAAASPAAGGRDAGRGAAAAPVAEVSDRERFGFIALPFSAAIAAAEQCDANRAEVLSWRESDRQLRDLSTSGVNAK